MIGSYLGRVTRHIFDVPLPGLVEVNPLTLCPVYPLPALSLIALIPIAIVMLFLVVLRWPAKKAMPLAYLVTVVIAFAIWSAPIARNSRCKYSWSCYGG